MTTVRLFPGQAGDGPVGRQLLHQLGPSATQDAFADPLPLRRVRAYQGDETWVRATSRDYLPVVPPHPHRKQPWTYDPRT